MTLINNRIHLLDSISQARIKSSVQIVSLNEVIVELVKNALDAQSTSIKVVLNYASGFCSVLDNGHGIPAIEFSDEGHLASVYCTSKVGQQEYVYGRHGRYLAALAGVSLLSIAARADDRDVSVLWLDGSRRIGHSKASPDTLEVNRGTRVKVYGLFSHLPVRSKQIAARFSSNAEVQKEFDQLQHTLTGLLLAFNRPFEIDVQHVALSCRFHHKPSPPQATGPHSEDTRATVDTIIPILYHAGYLEGPGHTDWVESNIDSGEVSIRAVVSLKPSPHKLVQFVAINHGPLSKSIRPELFQLVNDLFDSSSFGTIDNTSGSNRRSKPASQSCNLENGRPLLERSKGVDRWPMFVVWITAAPDTMRENLEFDNVSHRAEKLMRRITNLLRTLTTEFLVSHGFLQSRHEAEHASHVKQVELTSVNAANSYQKQSFQHWSRVKSSRGSVMHDVLSGLPFQVTKYLTPPTATPRDRSRPSSSCSSSGSTIAADLTGPRARKIKAFSPSRTMPNMSDQVIEWQDPQTGRDLRIDPRTGMVLPSRSVATKVNTNDMTRSPQLSGCHMARSRHRTLQALSLAQVADVIGQYSTGCVRYPDRPIRSIALFNEGGEDLSEQALTGAQRTESFWKYAGNDVGHLDSRATYLEAPRISKGALSSAKVLGQLDNKFVLTLVPDDMTVQSRQKTEANQLVLIDQHAADERCKVEELLGMARYERPTLLTHPIIFEVSAVELRLLRAVRGYFALWNILFDVVDDGNYASLGLDIAKHRVQITGLPPVIAERCRLNPSLIIDVLREEIWSDNKKRFKDSPIFPDAQDREKQKTPTTPSTNSSMITLFTERVPPRLLDLVNSRACRSAIMFNDELTIGQCQKLVRRLSTCTLPFQCAHGRPSMVVLSSLAMFPEHDPLKEETDLSTLAAYSNNTGRPRSRAGGRTASRRSTNESDAAYGQDKSSSHHYQSRTLPQPAKNYDRSSLNTINNNTLSFGQAYQCWSDQASSVTET